MPKFVLRAVLGRMQLTRYATRRKPYSASRLVQAMSAWLVKTRHAPSRHSRDARVYVDTTTAMHKLRTPRPPPARLRLRLLSSLLYNIPSTPKLTEHPRESRCSSFLFTTPTRKMSPLPPTRALVFLPPAVTATTPSACKRHRDREHVANTILTLLLLLLPFLLFYYHSAVTD